VKDSSLPIKRLQSFRLLFTIPRVFANKSVALKEQN